ncbi:uncharacterized protein LOC126982027 [Eriocheir sinensis]|uniref:uncharacterized protein LOC126982027 n=1 Tax=Eriocheir sinensis TaxID=95602 RepID=UPI0021C7D14E|nr:uncharacterized protein LOC126982027 [Eriocheir sinensis]
MVWVTVSEENEENMNDLSKKPESPGEVDALKMRNVCAGLTFRPPECSKEAPRVLSQPYLNLTPPKPMRAQQHPSIPRSTPGAFPKKPILPGIPQTLQPHGAFPKKPNEYFPQPQTLPQPFPAHQSPESYFPSPKLCPSPPQPTKALSVIPKAPNSAPVLPGIPQTLQHQYFAFNPLERSQKTPMITFPSPKLFPRPPWPTKAP